MACSWRLLWAVASLLSTTATGHMIMQTPLPFQNPPPDNSPLSSSGVNYPCKFDATSTTADKFYQASNRTSMEIGSTQTLSFTGSAVHGGGSCQLAVTHDLAPSSSTSWQVILSIEGGCPTKDGNGPSTYDYQIPQGLATGDAILAWTWISKLAGQPEYYMNCAPITITDSAVKGDESALVHRDTFPELFVANLASINSCKVGPGVDPLYPDPGDIVQFPQLAASMVNGTVQGTNCVPKANNGGSGGGSASSSSSGPSTTTAESSSSTSGSAQTTSSATTATTSSTAPTTASSTSTSSAVDSTSSSTSTSSAADLTSTTTADTATMTSSTSSESTSATSPITAPANSSTTSQTTSESSSMTSTSTTAAETSSTSSTSSQSTTSSSTTISSASETTDSTTSTTAAAAVTSTDTSTSASSAETTITSSTSSAAAATTTSPVTITMSPTTSTQTSGTSSAAASTSTATSAMNSSSDSTSSTLSSSTLSTVSTATAQSSTNKPLSSLVTSAAATPSTVAASSPTSTPSSNTLLTGSCTLEGEWNCQPLSTTGYQYQRCASGTWTGMTALPAGESCQVGLSMTLWRRDFQLDEMDEVESSKLELVRKPKIGTNLSGRGSGRKMRIERRG